jgi:hypothetical protein
VGGYSGNATESAIAHGWPVMPRRAGRAHGVPHSAPLSP